MIKCENKFIFLKLINVINIKIIIIVFDGFVCFSSWVVKFDDKKFIYIL